MSVLLGRDTRVLIQGLGREGSFHASRMKDYGTAVVGATKPGKGGTTQDGIPLFDTVAQAVDATGANASLIFGPAPGSAATRSSASPPPTPSGCSTKIRRPRPS